MPHLPLDQTRNVDNIWIMTFTVTTIDFHSGYDLWLIIIFIFYFCCRAMYNGYKSIDEIAYTTGPRRSWALI